MMIMTFADAIETENDLYDLLELSPDATNDEIRTAYLRIKAAYKKDSPALYSLISEDETEDLLRKIESAYQVLSNPERRKEYDTNQGLPATFPRGDNVISIDRMPPMEGLDDEQDILVAPNTDFSGGAPSLIKAYEPPQGFEPNNRSIGFTPTPSSHDQPVVPSPQPERRPILCEEATRDHEPDEPPVDSVEWSGPLLRKAREAQGVPLDELSDFTKIRKTYITAIENEDFGKLPAAVYLRGFVTQIAKYLKLPHERVLAAYLERYNQRPGKED